jgi:glycosyltransferase involved in cell wall biosynthesis
MKIWLRVSSFQKCSWTIVWNYLRSALISLGHEVPEDPFNFPPSWNPEEAIEVWWGDPVNWEWSKKKVALRVAMCLSEARSILKNGRDRAIKNVAKADVLLCPSNWASNAYREAPIDAPIHILPLGADPNEFHLVERDWTGTLNFLHLGNIQYRKGSWLAPEAFVKAFRKREDVKLTMACFTGRSSMFRSLEAEYGSDPRIEFIPEMKDSAMELYRYHHILVHPHLSEGFGLCIPEAMASGMCCLVSRCTAPLDFFSNHYGYWIEMSEFYSPVAQCLANTGGMWRLPDVNSLADRMVYAHRHRNECKARGDLAHVYVKTSLTWESTARGMVNLLRYSLKNLQEGSLRGLGGDSGELVYKVSGVSLDGLPEGSIGL